MPAEDKTASQEQARKLEFKPKPVEKKESRLLTLLGKIPLLSGFLHNVDAVGHHFSALAEVQGNLSQSLQAASSGFVFTGLALNIVDFFRIPAIYLASRLVGEKPPITLSNNARWLYSGAIVGAGAAAIALPVVALPIAIALSAVGFTVAAATLGKMLYRRSQLRKELKEINEQIDKETAELNALHKETKSLEEQISGVDSKDETQLSRLRAQLAIVETKFNDLFDKNQEKLQELYDKKHLCETKLSKKGTAAVVDKTITAGLSSLALAGVAVALFFPPVGLAILGACAAAGLTYLVGRIAYSFFKSKKTTKPGNEHEAKVAETPDTHAESSPEHDLSAKKDVSLTAQQSTAQTMNRLCGKEDVAQALQQQVANSQWMEKIDATLSKIVTSHDEKGMLDFLKRVSLHAQQSVPPLTTEGVKQFFGEFEDLKTASIALLQQTIEKVQTGEIKLSEEEKQTLTASQPLTDFLKEQHIEIQALVSTPNTTSTPPSDTQSEESQQQYH